MHGVCPSAIIPSTKLSSGSSGEQVEVGKPDRLPAVNLAMKIEEASLEVIATS